MPPKTTPTVKTDAELYELQDGCCFYCSQHMRPYPWRNKQAKQLIGYTRDHVTPQAHGGVDRLNIVLACYSCNTEKDNRVPTETELVQCRLLYCGYTLIQARAGAERSTAQS